MPAKDSFHVRHLDVAVQTVITDTAAAIRIIWIIRKIMHLIVAVLGRDIGRINIMESAKRVLMTLDAIHAIAIKGYWIDDGEPDLYLIYHASVNQQNDLQTSGYRSSWKDDASIQVKTIRAGTLMVEILDEDYKLLWRGLATATVSADPQKNQKKIHDIIEKMFARFPPP